MTAQPQRVSVVLTCYNEAAFIGAAVRSVMDQTRADLIDCIAIADDGSGEETLAVLRNIETWDPRIRVIYGAGGAGPAAQRNTAIASTQSPLVAILDADDIWARNKLELQLPLLAGNPQIGLVYCGYATFARDDLSVAHHAPVQDITAEPDLTLAYFTNDPPIITSTALFRRTAFEACGRFDCAIRVFEDTEFFLRLSRVCRFAFVDKALLYKRSRESSITGSRKDLMAHHAFVALKAAAVERRLLAFVPRRLSERARKLGNHRFRFGDAAEAKRLLWFAIRLDVFNGRAWLSLIAVVCFRRFAHRFIERKMRSRRLAPQVLDPADSRHGNAA